MGFIVVRLRPCNRLAMNAEAMKRLVPKVLENTYHVYSYKVQLVYNYTTHVTHSPLYKEPTVSAQWML